MSKHKLVCINTAGQRLVVEVGYDKPLQEFFANISTPANGEMIFTSLADAEEFKGPEWLLTTLATHGIGLPHSLICDLAVETMFGGSNSFVDHADFQMTELDETLLKAGFRQYMPTYLPSPSQAQWIFGSNEGPYSQPDEFLSVFDEQINILFPQSIARSPQLGSILANREQAQTREVLQEVASVLLVGLNDSLHREEGERLFHALQRGLGFAPCSVGFTYTEEE